MLVRTRARIQRRRNPLAVGIATALVVSAPLAAISIAGPHSAVTTSRTAAVTTSRTAAVTTSRTAGVRLLASPSAQPVPTRKTDPSTTGGGATVGPQDSARLSGIVAAMPDILNSALALTHPTDDNAIARKWSAIGGVDGPLGAAKSGVIPTTRGAPYTKFANGFIYDMSNGDVVSVLGKFAETLLQMGDSANKLGLPLAEQYLVPDGMRQDFENGSVILDQVTGVVKSVLSAYANSYAKSYNNAGPSADN